MKRIILLCFIHGFKGSEFTFGEFPSQLRDAVADQLPQDEILSIVYPKFETRGELAHVTEKFLEWLKERVLELRKQHLDNPWPPNDRQVGVVLVAHSMGGFIASDTLFRILDERRESSPSNPPFPLIHGILAFDTPFNGLARSMFVYGAFSNYQKVSGVFNLMTALTAATPAALSRLTTRRALATTAGRITKPVSARSNSTPAWKAWQFVALRTGTAGVIAAGGVLAFQHRRAIMAGVRHARKNGISGLAASSADAARRGLRSSLETIGQGLAYLNRGNVGASFAWLSDHFAFVGPLLRPGLLGKRLRRLARLRGVGVKVVYASLGENGVWQGGLFVPERTFCAVPTAEGKKKKEGEQAGANGGSPDEKIDNTPGQVVVNDGDEDASVVNLFVRQTISGAEDEVAAHVGMFRRERNAEYDQMVKNAAGWVAEWANDEREVVDEPEPESQPTIGERSEVGKEEATPDEKLLSETAEMDDIVNAIDAEGGGVEQAKQGILERREKAGASEGGRDEDGDEEMMLDDDAIPDESPLDIAAAASLIPLPDDADVDINQESAEGSTHEGDEADRKRAYLQHLMGIAQQSGTRLWSYMPSLPTVPPQVPKISIPAVSLPNMPNLPRLYPFSEKAPVNPAPVEGLKDAAREAV